MILTTVLPFAPGRPRAARQRTPPRDSPVVVLLRHLLMLRPSQAPVAECVIDAMIEVLIERQQQQDGTS